MSIFKHGNEVLPDNLKNKNHWDFPKFLQWIPRAWTAFDLGVPRQIIGSQDKLDARIDKKTRKVGPAPVGKPNSWQLSRFPDLPKPFCWIPLYFAWSGSKGKDGRYLHFRIGARFDNVDSYSEFPSIALRTYTGFDSQDTSTNKK